MDFEILLEGFLEFLRLSLVGVPISVGVFLFMEAFKASGIVESDSMKRIAPIILGLILAGLVQSIEIVESAELSYRLVVETVYQGVLAGLFSGLFYTQIVKRVRGDSPEE